MGLFSGKKISITDEDIQKINSLLPESLQKDVWSDTDFSEFNGQSLYFKFKGYYASNFEQKLSKTKNQFSKIELEAEDNIASKILIFNTELFAAEPIGFVDLGVVTKFGTASTGNRFENGIIGYAIEGGLDDVWSKSNAQYESVQQAKLELLKKARSLYPSCTSIFKFEIDFREIGSSGNVFIYVRGTAAKSENKVLEKTVYNIENEKLKLKNEIEEYSKLSKEAFKQQQKIPKNVLELKEFLNK